MENFEQEKQDWIKRIDCLIDAVDNYNADNYDADNVDPTDEDEVIEAIQRIMYDNSPDFTYYEFLFRDDEHKTTETNLQLGYQRQTLVFNGSKKKLLVQVVDYDEDGIKLDDESGYPFLRTVENPDVNTLASDWADKVNAEHNFSNVKEALEFAFKQFYTDPIK